MLIKAPPRKRLTSTHSIEVDAPKILRVRAIPFYSWLSLSTAASVCGVSSARLLYSIMNSSIVHAVRTPDGNVYVHPDGLIKFARSNGAKKVRAMARRIFHKYLQNHECQS